MNGDLEFFSGMFVLFILVVFLVDLISVNIAANEHWQVARFA